MDTQPPPDQERRDDYARDYADDRAIAELLTPDMWQRGGLL